MWTGGLYYIYNMINILNVLTPEKQPFVVVFCNRKDRSVFLKNVNYDKLSFYFLDWPISFSKKVINYFYSWTGNIKYPRYADEVQPDFIFPNAEGWIFKNTFRLNWIPDFQESTLPYLFSADELSKRKEAQRKVIYESTMLVLSSKSAENDFLYYYPDATCKIIILPFAVFHPDLVGLNIQSVKKKYNISTSYFICPNQFWTHKNHPTLISAVKILKDLGHSVYVILTGREYDYRDPEYTQRLKKMVVELGLEEQVRFLGFLEREDLLVLMKFSLAVVQPSLFEGWSTVIEDAKALGTRIIASDLPVHREQLDNWVFDHCFFDRNDALILAEKLKLYSVNPSSENPSSIYRENQIRYAKSILNLFDHVKQYAEA